MSQDKNPQEKTRLHPRNKNREPYDLQALKIAEPALAEHVKLNKYGAESVAFADPDAVKLLNKALLNHYYGVKNWDFPAENLCPPIPGRADYLHYMADLLMQCNFGVTPTGNKIHALDIGVGASCIYPIIGVTEYGWNFTGSDTDAKSIESAEKIVASNEILKENIECRLQKNPDAFFSGIVSDEEKFDFTLCNPPFHSNAAEAAKGSLRKVKNLSGNRNTAVPSLNFSGVSNELIYDGGEWGFIQKMIQESKTFGKNIYWFSTLVSKESNMKKIYKLLNEIEITMTKTIPMGTGNKTSRIISWSFLDKKEQQEWREKRWK